jgi:non-specific serine/threonine protein kinase
MDELDNIRSILSWTLDDENTELGARLIIAMREFLYHKGWLAESALWIEHILDPKLNLSPAIHTMTLNTYSRLAFAWGEHKMGEGHARRALSIAREINDKENCAWALIYLGSHLMASEERIKEAIAFVKEGINLFRELDNTAGIAYGLNALGELMRMDGNYSRAGQIYEECRILSKEMGNRLREGFSLGNLSYIAYHQCNYDQAIDYCRKALEIMAPLQSEYACSQILANIAGPICAKGDPKLAACLLACSEGLMKDMGARIQPADKLEIDQVKKLIRQELGETQFKQAWEKGRTMTFEQAMALALGETS